LGQWFSKFLYSPACCGSAVLGSVGFSVGFLLGLHAVGVKNAGFIDAFVSVRAEEVALRLQKICRKTIGAITVEVSERGGKRGDSVPTQLSIQTCSNAFDL
jgi:hypothetical protein